MMGKVSWPNLSGFSFRRLSDSENHRLLVWVLVVVAVLLPFPDGCFKLFSAARAADLSVTERDRLQQLEKKLQETRRRESSSRQQEELLLAELHAVSRERHVLELGIQDLQQQLQVLEKSMAGEEKQLRRITAAMDRQRREFNHRLKVRYMTPPGVLLERLFGQQELKDKMNQVVYLKHILAYDQQQLASFSSLLQEHQRIKRLLEKQRLQVVETKEQKRLKLAVLEENIAKKNKLLYKIRGKKEYYAALIKELAEAAEKLKEIIAARGQNSMGYGSLAKYKGRLPMPTSGVVVRFFGLERDRRFKTVTEHKGIDIEAPLGTAVKAIFPGQVIFASWLKGYGNLIIIDHGEGYYSIYGHLLEFKTKINQNIRQHDIIGSVGDTDSLIGPVLYFEIRKHGRPQDPLEWVSPMVQG